MLKQELPLPTGLSGAACLPISRSPDWPSGETVTKHQKKWSSTHKNDKNDSTGLPSSGFYNITPTVEPPKDGHARDPALLSFVERECPLSEVI